MFIEEIQNIINEDQKRYKEKEKIEPKDKIPQGDDFPLETNKWFRIDDIIRDIIRKVKLLINNILGIRNYATI